MSRFALILALFVVPLASQEQKAPQVDESKWERKVFQIKYVDPRSIANALIPFGVPTTPDYGLKTLSVRAPHDIMVAIQDVIKGLDVPSPAPKNIDLTFYLLSAKREPGGTGSLPAELEPVVKQLANLFAYKSFQLLDTAAVRSRDDRKTDLSGSLPGLDRPSTYSISFQATAVPSSDGKPLIRIDRLRLSVRVPVTTGPGQFQYQEVGINTDLDVREGQKVVVGKTNMDSSDRALIVVVTAKVVE